MLRRRLAARTVGALGLLLLAGCSNPGSYDACAPCAAPCAPGLIAGVQDVEAPFDTEGYADLTENPFLAAVHNPLSTFSVDVDTASYANVRRLLREGRKPPAGAVRIEELVNYFPYDYEPPSGSDAFSVAFETAACPWQPRHRLVRIGLKGKEFPRGERPPANVVFLIDVSGSMESPNKLPLVQRSLRLLLDELEPRDRVALVVYAGASGLVLPSTPVTQAATIAEAIDRLEAGGSTNGGEGIRLAYRTARQGFLRDGVNRVVLCTDGDFNVGVTNHSELVRLIQEEARSGVFLTVLGFGMGNYKDDTLEKLADRGNGVYGYVDDLTEARKLLVEQVGGSLVTIAKDVKIQVEFNAEHVRAYRLLGYENRLLAKEDFHDDTKDAGEIGAGHTVTALYEIVPVGVDITLPPVDPLRYQRTSAPASPTGSAELLTVKVRYKEPHGEASLLLEFPVVDAGRGFDQASDDLRFASAVAAFGMLLRDSPHKGQASFPLVAEIAGAAVGRDPHGYRAGFLDLVRLASR